MEFEICHNVIILLYTMQAATGESISQEDLGGAHVHCRCVYMYNVQYSVCGKCMSNDIIHSV